MRSVARARLALARARKGSTEGGPAEGGRDGRLAHCLRCPCLLFTYFLKTDQARKRAERFGTEFKPPERALFFGGQELKRATRMRQDEGMYVRLYVIYARGRRLRRLLCVCVQQALLGEWPASWMGGCVGGCGRKHRVG